jgi:hypothetical protein
MVAVCKKPYHPSGKQQLTIRISQASIQGCLATIDSQVIFGCLKGLGDQPRGHSSS